MIVVFDVKVGLHQGSVMSPLLFMSVMEVFSCVITAKIGTLEWKLKA